MEEKEFKEVENEIKEPEEEIVEGVNTDGKGKIYYPKTAIVVISVLVILMAICIIVIMCLGGPLKK